MGAATKLAFAVFLISCSSDSQSKKDEQDGSLYLSVFGTFFVMALLMNCAALAFRQKLHYGENEQVTYLKWY